MSTVRTPVQITRAGIDTLPTTSDATGDEWANTGAEYVHLYNATASPQTASFTIVATSDGLAVTAKSVTVANGTAVIVGPFPPSLYNNATTGRAKVTCSDVDLRVKVVKFVPD